MTGLLTQLMNVIDGNEQAQRAADAAWEAARWSFWMLVLTVGLLGGAVLAAVYAKRTWESTHKQLAHSNEQLDMARTANLTGEAVNVSAWLVARNSHIYVYVRNGNGGPVYDVRCTVWGKPDNKSAEPTVRAYEWHQVALSPAAAGVEKDKGDYRHSFDEASVVYSYADSDVRRTKSGSSIIALDRSEDFKVWNGASDSTGLAIQLTFRDSSGNRWHRGGGGELTPVPGPAPTVSADTAAPRLSGRDLQAVR